MIDFGKYTLQEMQAITTVLKDLTDEMAAGGYGNDFHIALNEYSRAVCLVADLIDQQARDHTAAEAEKVDRIVQACVAGAPPEV